MDRVCLSDKAKHQGGHLPFELYGSGTSRLARHPWLGSRYSSSFSAIHITSPAGNNHLYLPDYLTDHLTHSLQLFAEVRITVLKGA